VSTDAFDFVGTCRQVKCTTQFGKDTEPEKICP